MKRFKAKLRQHRFVLGFAAFALMTTQVQVQVAYTPLLQVIFNAVQQAWMLAHAAAFPVN